MSRRQCGMIEIMPEMKALLIKCSAKRHRPSEAATLDPTQGYWPDKHDKGLDPVLADPLRQGHIYRAERQDSMGRLRAGY